MFLENHKPFTNGTKNRKKKKNKTPSTIPIIIGQFLGEPKKIPTNALIPIIPNAKKQE